MRNRTYSACYLDYAFETLNMRDVCDICIYYWKPVPLPVQAGLNVRQFHHEAVRFFFRYFARIQIDICCRPLNRMRLMVKPVRHTRLNASLARHGILQVRRVGELIRLAIRAGCRRR